MEILSPAGSRESLEAAVHSGADAVYLGGNRFSARKNAQNFSDEALEQAVDFCHARGVLVYVCCNTLLKENELDDAMDFVHYTWEIGVDALIVQDLGLVARIRRELPDMPIHASTQMTVTNADGVNALADLGISRVVLAREVTAEGLASICKKTETDLEYFVHGALCISYSGQCLMSSLLGGRSGNRGSCAQPCRLPYTLLQDGRPVTEKTALLCPKDLCLADTVAELDTLGVCSLKIEGRMKSPDYVSMVTRVYRRAAEGKATEDEIRDMLKFFSRGGSCHGYYDGCQYGNMMDPEGQNKIADSLPDITVEKKKMPVTLKFVGKIGQPMQLTMTTQEGETVTVTGAVCEEARIRPTEAERVREQLVKLGETPFYAKEVNISLQDATAVSIKEINALRRKGAETLEGLLVNCFKRQPVAVVRQNNIVRVDRQPVLCAEVMTKEQLQAALDMGIERIYVPEALWEMAQDAKDPVLQLLPLLKEGMAQDVTDCESVCMQNIGQLTICLGKNIIAGHRMNVTNSESAELLRHLGVSRCVISPELNIKSIDALRRHTDMELEVIGYGRLPLMLMENCIIKSHKGCGCEHGSFSLLDRKNEVFPLYPTRCGNVIYNSKPIYMADRMEEIKKLHVDAVRMSFTLENYERCCIIISEYQAALAGKICQAPEGDFTRGHFYRGMQ